MMLEGLSRNGKGSQRRQGEDIKKFESNYDQIDWSENGESLVIKKCTCTKTCKKGESCDC